MPRTAILRPKLREARGAKGLAAWVVNVPPDLSPTGKRQELFFPTKSAASGECEKLKARKDNFGISLSTMTSARIAAAAEAYNLLDPHNIDLLDAVRAHLHVIGQKSASVTFEFAFDRFAELKQGKSVGYQQEIRHTKATFRPLLSRLICDVSAQDLEPILDRLPSAARNAKMRRLRSVFNLATKRGWMLPGTSPIARLDFADQLQKEVEIVPVDQVAMMLNHALDNDLELVPFLTLGFFCGIRPDGELQKIEWRDVDVSDRVVTIRPEVSKNNRRRFPELSENAIAWIEAYRQRGGSMEGRIVPFPPSVLRKKRRANWKAIAGEARWIQQGMRHSFCSNWLALHGDVNKLVLLSGHDSTDVMWRCYHKGVKKAQAERFWAITPLKVAPNIVEYRETA
jgi:integrase/recombinase XerD